MLFPAHRAALLALALLPGSGAWSGQFVQLTGWAGGAAEDIVPRAAETGFTEIIVWQHDPAYLQRLVVAAAKHRIGVYSCIHLGDLTAWNKRRPGVAPPLQQMNAAECAALERLRTDRSPAKSGYQFGGEPVQPLEVLEAPLLCFHHPEVRTLFQEQLRDLLAIPGLRGIALDYFGYRNYRCCRCPDSLAAFATWFGNHPGLTREEAVDRFSRDSLVDFINGLAGDARTVRSDAKIICHVYPVFLPEPLYGNRLDVDFCGQTAAWYFQPFWSEEKIRSYTRTICGEEKRYFARPEGMAMIGVSTRPHFWPVKPPERLARELQAIRDAGGDRVQVCSMNEVLNNPPTREVFRRLFAPGPTLGAAPGSDPRP